MENQDGRLSLHDYLEKYWDWFAMWRSPFSNDDDIAKRQDNLRVDLAKRYPDWSPEEIDITIRLRQIPTHLKDAAIARRFALDDPGELGRGLAVLNRFYEFNAEMVPESILEICASGDVELARRLVAGRCYGHLAIISGPALHMEVIYGILQRDSNVAERLIPQFALQKGVRPWLEGIYAALRGAFENRANEVARGLQMNLEGLNKMREKAELEGAINLAAHGLYRLFQSISPDLVSRFDAAQPFPWDADFHAWVQEHPNPLAELDLTGVSPVLHELIVHGKKPSWLTPRPEPLYEIVLLRGDPNSGDLLNEIETCAGGDGSLKSAKALLAHAPWPLRWNITSDMKSYLDTCQQRIEKFRGQAEVREMTPNRLRYFISAETGAH